MSGQVKPFASPETGVESAPEVYDPNVYSTTRNIGDFWIPEEEVQLGDNTYRLRVDEEARDMFMRTMASAIKVERFIGLDSEGAWAGHVEIRLIDTDPIEIEGKTSHTVDYDPFSTDYPEETRPPRVVRTPEELLAEAQEEYRRLNRAWNSSPTEVTYADLIRALEKVKAIEMSSEAPAVTSDEQPADDHVTVYAQRETVQGDKTDKALVDAYERAVNEHLQIGANRYVRYNRIAARFAGVVWKAFPLSALVSTGMVIADESLETALPVTGSGLVASFAALTVSGKLFHEPKGSNSDKPAKDRGIRGIATRRAVKFAEKHRGKSDDDVAPQLFRSKTHAIGVQQVVRLELVQPEASEEDEE